MKTLRYKFVLLLTVGALTITFAQEREKKINRSFQVNPTVMLRVDNQFGRIHIETWDKNQIDVEVVIRADMRSESRSQEFIDRVEIEISESSSLISLKTEYGRNMNSRNGESFSVDYTISMPVQNSLEVENKFGDIYLSDLTGDLDIDLKYGKMKGGKLTGKGNIEVAFGGADIEELANADLEFKYSDLNLYKARDIDLDQQFSNIEIDEMNDLRLRSKYGSVELGLVNSVDGSAGYTDFEIDELIQFADLDIEYAGGFRISMVRKGFRELKIDAQYSSMDVRLEEGVNAQFEGIFRYSDLRSSGSGIELNYVVKDHNRNEYKGNVGSGGDSRISVDSGYGDLRLGFTN